MLDEEFSLYATSLLDKALECDLDALKQFALLGARFFPPYFEALGFSRAEAELMTIDAIRSIELSLPEYRLVGRSDVKHWLSIHLNHVVGRALNDFRTAHSELCAAAQRRSEILQLPNTAGIDTFTSYRAARVISGDFVDCVHSGGGSCLIVIGDASGKGGAAAFYAVLIVGFLRAKAGDFKDPKALLRALNTGLLERRVGPAYVTLTVAQWDDLAGELTLCNAGGTLPVHVTPDGARMLTINGQPLGIVDTIDPDSVTLRLSAEDLLVLYSDGITDQENPIEEQYGIDRFRASLIGRRDLTPADLTKVVFEDLDGFRGGAELSDDQTIVLLQRAR